MASYPPNQTKSMGIDAICKAILDGPDPSVIVYDLAKRWRDQLIYLENFPSPNPLPDDAEVMVIFGVALPMECANVLFDVWIQTKLKKEYGPLEYFDRRQLCDQCHCNPCCYGDRGVNFVVDEINMEVSRVTRRNFWWDFESPKQMWGTLSHQTKQRIRHLAEDLLKIHYYDCQSDQVDQCLDLPPCLEKILDEKWDMYYYFDADAYF